MTHAVLSAELVAKAVSFTRGVPLAGSVERRLFALEVLAEAVVGQQPPTMTISLDDFMLIADAWQDMHAEAGQPDPLADGTTFYLPPG